MSIELNVENINSNRGSRRCCSFCRRPGHNITRCNSEIIKRFERETLNLVQLIQSQGQGHITNIEILREYLFNKALEQSNLIRAFAIRKCGLKSKSNIVACIIVIILYFITDIIQNIEENNNNENIQEIFDIKIKISDDKTNLEEKCECNICYEEREKKTFVKLDCGHEFCKYCIRQTLENQQRQIPCCAFCRTDIKNFELKLESIKNEFNDLIIQEF